MTASPTTSITFSSISISSGFVTSGRSVSLDTKRAVSSALGTNLGSTMRWMRVEEYSATSLSSAKSFSVNSPSVPADISLFSTWMAPSVMVVLSGTVSIERTSKPVVWAIDCMKGAWLSVLRKNTGSPVSMTLPTMPFPSGSFSARSLAAVS